MNILRMKQLIGKVGLAKPTIYRKIKQGSFPKPFAIGDGRAAGLLENDIDAWIAKHAQPVDEPELAVQ
jgi:prophage regulatory protein